MDTFTFQSLGTAWWIEIFDDISESKLETISCHLELVSKTFNDTYSRFLPNSLISKLNRERRLVNPNEELCSMLLLGKQLYVRSSGLFNILTGHIQEARGYDARYSFVAKIADTVYNSPACNPVTDITIAEDEVALTCGNADLGGFGKGWLIDLLAADLKAHDINHFLINGGGDMYGTSLCGGEPITIYLEHPTVPGTYLLETTLQNQGFAASSPFKRQWKSGDMTYSHVISNIEVESIATFVKARSAVEADAFATVAMIMPEASLPALAECESLMIARFNPQTNDFWKTVNFN